MTEEFRASFFFRLRLARRFVSNAFPGLAILIFVLAAVAAIPESTLREAADHAGLLVGTAVRVYLFSEPAYSETLAREFNMVEPEDAMKWGVVRENEGEFDFRQGDEIVRFAQAHGMKVRGHCLVWDHSNPEWLTKNSFTPGQLSRLLSEHITAEMKHYAGQVFAWDVVNEALNENGRAKDSIWYNQPGIGFSGQGTAYIEQAFRWAHEADPKALLFYNDAEAEGVNRKSDAIYAMVRDFKNRGVPIDGVGLQMHISRLDFDMSSFGANIKRLTGLGLQVHVTELDVSLPMRPGGQFRADDLRRQAEIYRGAVRACVQNPRCTAIQTWGFTDKYSWIGSHSRGTQGGALPFDRSYQPKPAYRALLQEVAAAHSRE